MKKRNSQNTLLVHWFIHYIACLGKKFFYSLMMIFFSGLHEFEVQKNHEVNEFRTKMRVFCEEKAQERQRLPWHQWMEYSFPCDLEPCCSPQCGSSRSKNTKKILINIKFEASDVSRSTDVVFVSHIGSKVVQANQIKCCVMMRQQ